VTPTCWPAGLAMRLGVSASVAVDHHDVHVPSSLGSADTLRIAFASDFHAGPMTPPDVIDQAITQLSGANADLLLLGGDFVSLRAEYARDLVSRLASVPAPLGRYAVLGNHDYWADGAGVAGHLQSVGIEVLTNRHVRLASPFGNVSICGVDDHTSGEPDADAAFRGSEAVRVVLMHAPSGLLDIGERSFAVALCGHTHGGQMALPNGRPLIVAHGRLSRRYNAGRFAINGDKTLLVSRGIGCSAMPFRFNAAPNVLTCTIHGRRRTAATSPNMPL